MRVILFIVLLLAIVPSCADKRPEGVPEFSTGADLLHGNMAKLTEVVIHDIFSPPVSSRIYSYCSIAAYEALRFQKNDMPSYVAALNGFGAMPHPAIGKNYDFMLAATKAFFAVATRVTFSTEILKLYEDSVYRGFAALVDKATYNNSVQLGDSIAQVVLARAAGDRYKETRGMPKFTGSYAVGKWRPTPPEYADASEPFWSDIAPLTLDSATQFRCSAPPRYSLNPTSMFFKTVKEVYTLTSALTTEQVEIARYWDDNPFVIEHAGHVMFGSKKITPVGHWMGITTMACRKKNADALTSAKAYMLTSTAMFDAIIACWRSKYEYEHIRPITVINENIEQGWVPLLQTPPFPEHPSGHSGISAAAASILTDMFGSFPFKDSSDLEYIGMTRTFSSFDQAAREASISRVYGGIHYTTGVNAGAEQGTKVAEYVSRKFAKAK